MVFLLSAGGLQGFPGARQSSSVSSQSCVMQHTTGTNAAGIQMGGAARRTKSFVVQFGIFGGVFSWCLV